MAENDYIVLREEARDSQLASYDKANPSLAVRKQLAYDLNIPIEEVHAYFQNYYLNGRFPIRKLTTDEQAFCRAVLEIKYMDTATLLGYLAQYQITPDEHRADRLLLPREIANMADDENYRTFLRWADYLLEPYLTYQNTNPPVLRPLSKMELFLIVSNIAVGNSTIPGKEVEIRDQLVATQKLIDAYSLIPDEDQIEDEEETYEDLTPAELKTAARLITEKDLKTFTEIKKKNKKNKA